GHYFTCSGGFEERNGISNAMAFSLSFTDEEFRNERKSTNVVGTAMWFASNGNDFLYASANLYPNTASARDVQRKLAASYLKAKKDIHQNDSGKPGGLTDPFN